MQELLDAVRRFHDTPAGRDEIHYQLLICLPKSSLFYVYIFDFNHFMVGPLYYIRC